MFNASIKRLNNITFELKIDRLNKFITLVALVLLVACKKQEKKERISQSNTSITALKYAEGFTIISGEHSKIIEINSPWPNANKVFTHEFLNEELPINEIVVTSTTHIPALELLGVAHTLVGFPGTDYVSSKKTRARIESGAVRELGKNEGINTEVLLELQPDIVIGFGVDGSNRTFETIKKSGIPVIYNGDWVENSPLAKAEWIKFFGVLFNKEKEADSIFNEIELNYLNAKELAATVSTAPTIVSGALHKDVWYLPSGTSPEAQFLKDANVNYLWKDTSGQGSLALNFETVYEKGSNADIWLSPSYYASLEALNQANEHYSKFKAFKNKMVYSFSTTTGATGGVTYYEMGFARPDLVLKDIIKICHQELLPDYQTNFFKPLK